jgi:UTP--glucose-1-phosphate uridylyltransferase
MDCHVSDVLQSQKIRQMKNNRRWSTIRNVLTDDGAPLEFVARYKLYYEQLSRGELGLIAEDDLVPLRNPHHHDNCRDTLAVALGEKARKLAVMVKLNGGHGTGMGMEGSKSLLKVRGERSFLELAARQAEH